MGVVSQRLRDSARGQVCTFAIPGVCNHNPETVVLCHIRDEAAGKATKAHDLSSAFGCYACHELIDQHRLPKVDELFYSLRAMQRTQARWFELGLLTFPAKASRQPPLTKIVQRPEHFRR